MVSYDNYLDVTVLPVTTVDLGGVGLAYSAFHFLLDDIPGESRNADGVIVAEPAVDWRGSLARVQ